MSCRYHYGWITHNAFHTWGGFLHTNFSKSAEWQIWEIISILCVCVGFLHADFSKSAEWQIQEKNLQTGGGGNSAHKISKLQICFFKRFSIKGLDFMVCSYIFLHLDTCIQFPMEDKYYHWWRRMISYLVCWNKLKLPSAKWNVLFPMSCRYHYGWITHNAFHTGGGFLHADFSKSAEWQIWEIISKLCVWGGVLHTDLSKSAEQQIREKNLQTGGGSNSATRFQNYRFVSSTDFV